MEKDLVTLPLLHDTPAADPSRPVMVAGDPEHSERIRRMEEGIEMVPKLVQEVCAVASGCGAEVLLPTV